MHRIVILGPQGAGKGTQAELLAKHLKVPAISTGEIYRREIEQKTDLGQMAASFINQGKLAPDELTNDLIRMRLTQDDCKNGFVLDGYPRNAAQMAAMESIAPLTCVLEIVISDKEAIKRLAGRRVCPRCGESYHTEFKKPREDEMCDACKVKLTARDDDKPEAIKERLEIYHRATEPLAGFYQGKGILRKINGEQAIEKVFEDAVKAIG